MIRFNRFSASDCDALTDILCIYLYVTVLLLTSVCGTMSLVLSEATFHQLVELPGGCPTRAQHFFYN